jgi:signal transduction histidine kinase
MSDTEIPQALLTERMLLSALREQDAAAAADVARRRAEFLAKAGLRLGASLDQELTYAAIAGLALPGLDAWCVVDVVEVGGAIRRVGIVHPGDDERVAARRLADRWAPAADGRIGVPAVARGRAPVIIPEGAEALLAAAGDPDVRGVLQRLGAGPVLVVPIVAHDVLLGAITYVSRPGAPGYTPQDVQLAEGLAARCSQALESARLYAAARASWAEAEAARARADAANATKVRFLGTVSHELRTPLTAIGGYAQLLAMELYGPVTDAQRAALERIRLSGTHLQGLVDGVLGYTMLEAGRTTYRMTDVDLDAEIATVEALLAPQFRTKGVGYTPASAPTPAPTLVRADAEKLRQVLLNLLTNALKFTDAGGQVDLGYEVAADGVAIRVRDTGRGIPADKLEAVFEPFVQVGRTLTSTEGGVGLGLAISRELARGMGGDLTVGSEPGRGSTFTVTLDAAGSAADRRTGEERRRGEGWRPAGAGTPRR